MSPNIAAAAWNVSGWDGHIRRASRIFTVSERLREFAMQAGRGARKGQNHTQWSGCAALLAARQRAVPPQVRICAGLPSDRFRGRAGRTKRPSLRHPGPQGHFLATECLSNWRSPAGRDRKDNTKRSCAIWFPILAWRRRCAFWGRYPADAMAEVMSAADVLCLASTNEGWPNVVHEALACGTPVVATDVGAVANVRTGPVRNHRSSQRSGRS